MPGLNDDVEDNLFLNKDVHVDNKNKDNEITTDDEISLEKIQLFLPNVNTNVKDVVKKLDQLSLMLDLNEEVISLESISTIESDLINSYFDGFYNDKLAKESFTHHRTKVNFQYSKDFMNKRIAVEKDEIFNTLNQIKEEWKYIEKIYSLIEDKIFPDLEDKYRSIENIGFNEVSGILKNKNLVFAVNNEFINLLTIPLVDLNSKKLDLSTLDERSRALFYILKIFATTLNSPDVYGFYDLVNDSSKNYDHDMTVFEHTDYEKDKNKYINLSIILNNIINHKTKDELSKIMLKLEGLEEYLDNEEEGDKIDSLTDVETIINKLNLQMNNKNEIVHIAGMLEKMITSFSLLKDVIMVFSKY